MGLVPCTAAISGLFYQPQMIGKGDCGAIGGMKIGRGIDYNYLHAKSLHIGILILPILNISESS
jgi:hypothetical protein